MDKKENCKTLTSMQNIINIQKEYNEVIIDANNVPTSKLGKQNKRVLALNNSLIEYTHIIPTRTKIKSLSFIQRLKVLFGIEIDVHMNTYLDGNKIVSVIILI